MFARIGVMRALNRHVERMFDPSRKEKHWGKRKLARDRAGSRRGCSMSQGSALAPSEQLASRSLRCTLHDHERKQRHHADIFGNGVNIAARMALGVLT
jgi:hypothetical protein